MPHTLRSPEELLPYRTIGQVLAGRGGAVYSVGPADTALAALRSMAEKHVGLMVVLEDGRLAGVVSERDVARRVVLAGRDAERTLVREIMTREVVTVAPADRFAECLKLMERHHVRHLPVVDGGRVVGVLSGRDLAREAIAHFKRVFAEIEQERLTLFVSPV